MIHAKSLPVLLTTVVATACHTAYLTAAPTVKRLTPPSILFSHGDAAPPITARFIPEQRFDLQATVTPDEGQTITSASFAVEGQPALEGKVAIVPIAEPKVPAGTVAVNLRAVSLTAPGVHTFSVTAEQSDGQKVTAKGNFEIVPIAESGLPKVKNVIFMIGDGFGIAHRTAARIVAHSPQQGKARGEMALDTLPFTGIVSTASLNSIVTDSSAGASCYSTGNKAQNGQHGVFPDDTEDPFDNPRVELITEYLARKHGKSLGIVSTAEVHDSTPAAYASHTGSRHAGTGICDQFLDEAATLGSLKVLLGGGLKWFLPKNVEKNGSGRDYKADSVLPADLTAAWGVQTGAVDPNRDLLADFQAAGFTYVDSSEKLKAVPAETEKLLGLFHLNVMSAAYDKMNGRRGQDTVVREHGFPDQPMLDEMTDKALQVLSKDPDGFFLTVEGASIDKLSHAMDTDRWILEVVEFDKAVAVAKKFAEQNPDTLIVVTADHETGGAGVIGASRVTNEELKTRAVNATPEEAKKRLLDEVVVGSWAGFPQYKISEDGYPVTMDPDKKLLINYAAGADRYEDWLTNEKPSNQPNSAKASPEVRATYPQVGVPKEPGGHLVRDMEGGLFIPGMFTGASAAHTGTDLPCYAFGPGASQFTGTLDNTDLYFGVMQAVLGGAK